MFIIELYSEAAANVSHRLPHRLKMSSLSAASIKAAPVPADGEQKPLKPCCACPETKKVRDACIIEKGEENCAGLIEAHKECMRALGFKV
ncbi:hypothetical protein LDENG_00161140 [Lucifuga dentata]|nr:hypothetical protein LDENG_00161140 [Lucifuga dentata]